MQWLLQFVRLRPLDIQAWFDAGNTRILRSSVLVTLLGTAVYGLTIGLWRGPEQALFVAVKFPLLILITTGLNALLNWFVALMIGADFSFLQTLKYQFISYSIASLLLLSLAPISLFFLWSAPALGSADSGLGNSLITLLHVVLIALAGTISNLRLFAILQSHLNSRVLARGILFAWLAGSLFLGCQISWILRPFIGSPSLEIQFLRPKPLEGNFYTDVYSKLKAVATHKGAPDEYGSTRTR